MSQKFTKQQLRSPDMVTAELQKGFTWTTQHSKLVGLLVIAFVVVGGGFAATQYFQNQKESELQVQYFEAEKAYFTAKTATPVGDITAPAGQLESIIEKAPTTKAAAMSALLLSQIHDKDADRMKAEEALGKVKASGQGLLPALVTMELGNVRADLGKCDEAVQAWDQVLANKEVSFLYAQAHINKGLCLQKTGKRDLAKESFTAAKAADPQSEAGRSADKYLRLLEQGTTVQ